MAVETRLLGPVERALHLSSMQVLSDLDADSLATLANHVDEHTFQEGESLLERGSPVRIAHIVVEGKVQCMGGGSGPEGRVVGARQGLGMLSLLSQCPDGMQATAMEETLTLGITFDTVHDIFEDDFSLWVHQMRTTALLTLDYRKKTPNGTVLSPRPESVRCPDRALDLVERIALIRGGPFANASVDALWSMASGMDEFRAPAGTPLWQLEQRSGYLLFLLDGWVKAIVEPGRELRFGPGYPMGNLESLAQAPRWYEAVAETDIVALRGETDAFLDLLEDHFGMAMTFLGAMALNAIELLEGQTTCEPIPPRTARTGEFQA